MNFTRSKIICTVGPATDSIRSLRQLQKSGMNVVRINMSHATHSSAITTSLLAEIFTISSAF